MRDICDGNNGVKLTGVCELVNDPLVPLNQRHMRMRSTPPITLDVKTKTVRNNTITNRISVRDISLAWMQWFVLNSFSCQTPLVDFFCKCRIGSLIIERC